VLGVVSFLCLGDVGVERDRDCDASEDDATLVEGAGNSAASRDAGTCAEAEFGHALSGCCDAAVVGYIASCGMALDPLESCRGRVAGKKC
jgi:hypothetical protein